MHNTPNLTNALYDGAVQPLHTLPHAPPCLGKDELFFSISPAQKAEAVEICLNCPFMVQCRENAYAYERDLPRAHRHGVWGGELPRARYFQDKVRKSKELRNGPDDPDRVQPDGMGRPGDILLVGA